MHCKNTFSELADFQEESLRNQAFLLERVQNLENLLLNSLQNRGANSRWAGWKWPIKTTADVDAVELWLLDPRNYQEEVCTIYVFQILFCLLYIDNCCRK